MKYDNVTYLSLAAIISEEVATGHSPLLFARRDEPVEQQDSGWQFRGNPILEISGKAQVWMLKEVLDFEPSLEKYIHSAVGMTIVRDNTDAPWKLLQSKKLGRTNELGEGKRII